MLTSMEQFVVTKFDSMPLAVRIIVYLLVVLVLLYLILSPRFVTGRVFVEVDGRQYPYRDASIEYVLEGRTIKATTDSRGFFSIPVVALFPREITFYVINLEDDSMMAASVPSGRAWSQRFGGANSAFRVDDGHVTGVPESASLSAGRVSTALRSIFPGAPALYAQELVLPGELRLPRENTLELPGILGQDREQTATIVAAEIARVLRRPIADITADFAVTAQNGASATDRIVIVVNLEEIYGMQIPDEHWRQLRTVQAIVDYIQERLVFSAYLEERGIDYAGDYRQSLQMLPPQDRPEFF